LSQAESEDEVRICFNPLAAAERVAHYSGLVRSRLLWLGLAAVICLAVWLLRRQQLDRATTLALFAVGLGYSLVWLAMAVVGLVRAKHNLSLIGHGIALRVGRWGIDLHGVAWPWPDIAAVKARRRRFSALGPDLAVVTTSGRTMALPWLYLDALPGAVDAAVWAHSAGRLNLDVSGLDD
jgi:hypothetical protein